MAPEELSPVERSALIVLMAKGRPLKESGELKSIHGIDLKANHRKKLLRLGLIETTPRPYMHLLTEKGWRWARKECSAARPKGQMGMGALYALLHALQKHAERQNCDLKDIFTADGVSADPIGKRHAETAAWSEADEALGQALQDMPVFYRAVDKLKEATNGDTLKLVERASKASNLVFQSVRQAARRRELRLAADVGAEVSFDPMLHRSDEPLANGERAIVRKPPVVRGPESLGIVVLVGEVDPA